MSSESEATPVTAQKVKPPLARKSGRAGRKEEVGGRQGPEPTRYGDWEKQGRCIDF
ncbi:MAG: DUF1674 domain-containing protein [Methylococcus sp.]|jgi:hypothetical protein|nr:MAG: DUF1674 domain-containing protein [Methylococcus sp.]